VWDHLERNGISEKPKFTKIISAKRLYHYDSLERLEKVVV